MTWTRKRRSDTGRIQVAHAALTAGRVWVQRTGDVVFVDFEGAVFGSLAGTQTITGLIPAGYRTSAATPFSTVGVYGPVRHCRTFGAAGDVQIFGLVAGDTLQAHVVYRATDAMPGGA